MNTFGRKLTLTTFGESHGAAIGGVLDGFPAGVRIDLDYVQSELDKRKPGGSKFATARKESDRVEILSGVFDGVSTGTPIGFIIRNENQKSGDYENLRELFRPGHADYAYYRKYAVRDHRGGGRSSAREAAVRVAGGAIAQILLAEFGIEVRSGVASVGEVSCGERLDFELAESSEIFSLGNENAMKEEILKARRAHDSVGASVVTVISGAPAGLGEGLYYKFDAAIAAAMMGINGVKAVEIGEGVNASKMRGSENNDAMGAAYVRGLAGKNASEFSKGGNLDGSAACGGNLSDAGNNSTLDGADGLANLSGSEFDEFANDDSGEVKFDGDFVRAACLPSKNANEISKNGNLDGVSDLCGSQSGSAADGRGGFCGSNSSGKFDEFKSDTGDSSHDTNWSDAVGARNDSTLNDADGRANLNGKFGFASNRAGGTLGGMTSGQDIVIKTHFKPTPSIFLSQPTQNLRGEDVLCELRGRHDPCIGVRGSVVATAMARLVTADMLLLNLSSNLTNLKKIYTAETGK